MAKVGDRVVALLSSNQHVIRSFGEGVYDGDFDVEVAPGVVIPNPRITLDTGEIVWGFECWWGPAAFFKDFVGNRTVEKVTVADIGKA